MDDEPLPDPIAELRGALQAALGLPVSVETPQERPTKWVQLEPAGGEGDETWAARPRVILHCWAETNRDAYLLGQQARAAVINHARAATGGVHDADASWPASQPHPDIPQPRSVCTAALTII